MIEMRVPVLEGTPACADRLDLVDAAFITPGKADDLLALCRRCPVAATCLDLAMVRREEGVWGGTSPNRRSRANPSLKRAAVPNQARVCSVCGVGFEGAGNAKLCSDACRTENTRRYMQQYHARRAKR